MSAPTSTSTQESLPLRQRRSIILVGLMGVGKSSVGRALAKRLHLPFVDSDAAIEAHAGRTISEIFDTHGEEWFRQREYETIRDLLANEAVVLATGGGAFEDARIRACARQYGVSIWLQAPLKTLAERLTRRGFERRPLLREGDPLTILKKLMKKRERFYEGADIITQSRSIPKPAVVENILEALEALALRRRDNPLPESLLNGSGQVHIPLGERSYDIMIGNGLLARAGEFLRPLLKRPRVFVVADETVAEKHQGTLLESLKREEINAHVIPIPPGEASKSFGQLQKLLEQLLDKRIERGDMLIAFGGGVVGDLAGCAAGLALRGIDFIQIPTTLLAQVDSSVGGKTGINVPQGKNLVGVFHQPRLVLADTSLLKTLPARHLAAGYAEVVKYALIGDLPLFNWFETRGKDIIAGDSTALRQAIWSSCRAKASIVAADEREAGVRALLNLGHSFGHALEHAAGYGDQLLHGEAVAVGMSLAFGFSRHLDLCAQEDVERVRAHLDSVGLPTSLRGFDFPTDGSTLMDAMLLDKKNKDGKLTLILAHGIGRCFRAEGIDPEQVRDFLDMAGKESQ
ncbi:MAG: 3-dehydroquinate synthase [Hyphomicrobiales bacterium]|nr:3-dehydroquinate synthase [Hyphomicrobiales bacterium]